MSEPGSDQPVKVTAQERAHPAIRTLARACIALARAAFNSTPAPQEPATSAEASESSGEDQQND